MPRAARNAKVDSRTSRAKLAQRREPFWTSISKGSALGYRRGSKGGTWIARLRDAEGKQHFDALGAADDLRDADGVSVFNFAQAQERARAFFGRKAREFDGHPDPLARRVTVAEAIEEYLAHRLRRGSKGVRADTYAAKARIIPELGEVQLAKLTTKRIRDWHDAVASAPRMVRTSRSEKKHATRDFDADDPDQARARRSTANRLLTVLKAALNHAFHEGLVAVDEPWRKVKPFREVDAAVLRYLSVEECHRLVKACPPDFRALVRGAPATGCRYGELTRLTVSDFNAESATVTIRISKAGKVRHVALADEGRTLFVSLTMGRDRSDLIFLRGDSGRWGPSHQQRPLIEASRAAGIEPAVTFHVLRHTYGSTLAMRGVPMGVIAAQLGHSDTRMTEKHYAHLSPSYIADTIRASLPALGDL